MAYGKAEDFDGNGYMTWIGDSRSQKGLFECKDGRWVHCWPPSPRFMLAAAEGDAKGNADPGPRSLAATRESVRGSPIPQPSIPSLQPGPGLDPVVSLDGVPHF